MRVKVRTVLLSLSILFIHMTPVIRAAETMNSEPSAPAPTSRKAEHDKQSIVTSRYHIGPEDVLEIVVWRNPQLSKVVAVRPDGRISLPLIGDVRASGLTPMELTGEVLELLEK